MNTLFTDVELGELFTELKTLGMPVEHTNTGGNCEAIRWVISESNQEILLTNLDQPSGVFSMGIYDIGTGEITDYFGEYDRGTLIRTLRIFANMRGNA